jgi:hypothetical protein
MIVEPGPPKTPVFYSGREQKIFLENTAAIS